MKPTPEARGEEWAAARGWLALASFLRIAGDPGQLEAVAEGLAHGEDPGLQEAADRLLDLAVAAREVLAELEEDGFVFDAQTRRLRLRTDRRGPGVKLLTMAIVAAYRDLDDPDGMYTGKVCEDVRERLARHLHPDDVQALTDTTIRRALERWL